MTARRVLYLNPIAAIGGAERSLLALMEGIDRQAFDPILAVPSEGPLADAAKRLDVTVKILPFPTGFEKIGRFMGLSGLLALPRRLARLPAYLASLRRLVASEAVDLVHSNGAKSHVLGALAVPRTGTPLVWHWRDLPGRGGLRDRLMARLSRRVDCTIVNSQAVRERLTTFSCPTRLVYNPIDTDRFRPLADTASLVSEFPALREKRIIGAFTILAPPKGLETLLSVFARLAERRPHLALLVVGDEIYATEGHEGTRARLEARAEGLGVADRVVFTGFRDDVHALMNLADVCVHVPTVPESFGRAVAEAMACGRPVVAAASGGTKEIVTHERDGLLVSPGNEAEMERAIERLLDDEDFAARLGDHGRRTVRERFGKADHCRGVEAVYREVLV